ncbi:hypothetical protein ABGB17_24405 [Sphaerisporangium sp. B11E5]|uniref:hypothetical protein n=1 Tax=Sphaerisporangium sp. B11E5 TaxID=3153563 RepID=UPI00325E67B3
MTSGADGPSQDLPAEPEGPREPAAPSASSEQAERPAAPVPAVREHETAADAEVAEIVGKLAEPEGLDGAERRRLVGRLSLALADAARKAKASGGVGGRWLADLFASIVPRLPIRDLQALQEHHYGLTGEQLADDLVRTASKATMAVGAVGGAVAAAEFAAPPLLLSAPAQLVAETLVVAAIEVKLIAELHAVYGVQVQGNGTQRALAFSVAWSKQRGVDPLAPASVTLALGAAAKAGLRKRLLRTLGRHLTTLGPFLTGAIAGGALNRIATRRLAEVIRADLRRQRALPPAP